VGIKQMLDDHELPKDLRGWCVLTVDLNIFNFTILMTTFSKTTILSLSSIEQDKQTCKSSSVRK
jgi:hypothetical protein